MWTVTFCTHFTNLCSLIELNSRLSRAIKTILSFWLQLHLGGRLHKIRVYDIHNGREGHQFTNIATRMRDKDLDLCPLAVSCPVSLRELTFNKLFSTIPFQAVCRSCPVSFAGWLKAWRGEELRHWKAEEHNLNTRNKINLFTYRW